jgi:hypothetical protein
LENGDKNGEDDNDDDDVFFDGLYRLLVGAIGEIIMVNKQP